MKQYVRVRLGRGGQFAADCLSGGFVGVDFSLREDLTGKLPEHWRQFNDRYIPEIMRVLPQKSKVGAGLACGAIWVLCKGVQTGSLVLCPDETGAFHIGEITGPYEYHEGGPLPHRRPVRWMRQGIDRAELSPELWASVRGPHPVVGIEKHAATLDELVRGCPAVAGIVATTPEVEDPIAFAMEKHLEEFLVSNWAQTELAESWRIFEEEGEVVGQQYQTDTGPLDILAVSHDRKRLLVVELKRGRASDVVVGQILRYMGYVQEELAEPDQVVEGVIIALEDDQRLRRALEMTPQVRFMRYSVSFRLSSS